MSLCVPVLHLQTLRLRSSGLDSLMPGPMLCCLEDFGGNAGRSLGELRGSLKPPNHWVFPRQGCL